MGWIVARREYVNLQSALGIVVMARVAGRHIRFSGRLLTLIADVGRFVSRWRLMTHQDCNEIETVVEARQTDVEAGFLEEHRLGHDRIVRSMTR